MDRQLLLENAISKYGDDCGNLTERWLRLIEHVESDESANMLSMVNEFFNRSIYYGTDQEVWNEKDYWATVFEMFSCGAGDCEDIAIAKYITLKLLGVPDDQLRVAYVKLKSTNEAHMVLFYYDSVDSDNPIVLDNLVSSLRPLSRRPDLINVFSFNLTDLWAGDIPQGVDPTQRLSRWQNYLEKLAEDGLEV